MSNASFRAWKSSSARGSSIGVEEQSGKFGTLAEFLGFRRAGPAPKPDGSGFRGPKLLSSPINVDCRRVAKCATGRRKQRPRKRPAGSRWGTGLPGNSLEAVAWISHEGVHLRGRLADYVLRLTEPQHFFLQQGRGDGENDSISNVL